MRNLLFILPVLLFSCHQKQPEGNTIYHRLIDDLEIAAKRIKKDNIATFVQGSHATHWLRPADLKLVRQMYLVRKETDRISNYLDSTAADTNIVDLKLIEQQLSNYLSLLDSLSDETFPPLINTSVMDPFALQNRPYTVKETLNENSILSRLVLKQMKYKLLDLENSYLNSTVVRFGMGWPTERIEATFSPAQKTFTEGTLPDSLSTFIYLYSGQAAIFINKVSVNEQLIDYDPFEGSNGKMIFKAAERATGDREFTIELDVWTADGLDSIVVINKNALLVKKCDE